MPAILAPRWCHEGRKSVRSRIVAEARWSAPGRSLREVAAKLATLRRLGDPG
jgi:hypothetical protein